MLCCTASTTTMASSTTRPIASTNPKSERVLIVKPSRGKTMKVPINDTGTVINGIRVARQLCRKRYTTRVTSTTATTRVLTISLRPWVTGSVVSSETSYSRSGGNLVFNSSMTFLTWVATASAFEPFLSSRTTFGCESSALMVSSPAGPVASALRAK